MLKNEIVKGIENILFLSSNEEESLLANILKLLLIWINKAKIMIFGLNT